MSYNVAISEEHSRVFWDATPGTPANKPYPWPACEGKPAGRSVIPRVLLTLTHAVSGATIEVWHYYHRKQTHWAVVYPGQKREVLPQLDVNRLLLRLGVSVAWQTMAVALVNAKCNEGM